MLLLTRLAVSQPGTPASCPTLGARPCRAPVTCVSDAHKTLQENRRWLQLPALLCSALSLEKHGLHMQVSPHAYLSCISLGMLHSPAKARFLLTGPSNRTARSLWLQRVHLAGKEEVIISSYEKSGKDLFPFCTYFWLIKLSQSCGVLMIRTSAWLGLPVQRRSLVNQFGRAPVSFEQS